MKEKKIIPTEVLRDWLKSRLGEDKPENNVTRFLWDIVYTLDTYLEYFDNNGIKYCPFCEEYRVIEFGGECVECGMVVGQEVPE